MSARRIIVAIVGRPNVGKSTLFNRIVGERRAIVLDTPGVTRDRNYGDTDWFGVPMTVIDTGGFEPDATEGVVARMREQALAAIEEADVVLFIFDGKSGLLPADREVVQLLRQSDRRVVYLVNKIDAPQHLERAAEFYELGLEEIHAVSAAHGRGLDDVMDLAMAPYDRQAFPETPADASGPTRVAVIGRPNAGKSTLVNRLLGEERMIADPAPGTTRDAIDSELVVGGRPYTLIDTAGLRRKRGIRRNTSEAYSVMRTIRALERCHVAVLLIDATEGVTDQDAKIAGLCDERGRALILAVNKWDAIEKDAKTAKAFTDSLHLKLPFTAYAPHLFISGLTGQRAHRLLPLVDTVRAAHLHRVPTGPINRWLERVTGRHHPPVVRGRRLKFYFATQVAVGPPTIVIRCNGPQDVHFSYQRYLKNQLRESFAFAGTPIRIFFRGKGEQDGRGG